jgi:hypothetical protein
MTKILATNLKFCNVIETLDEPGKERQAAEQ